jgi:hypothetical protein
VRLEPKPARASPAPEVALLRRVVEAWETDIEPRGTVPLEEAAKVPVATHRDDRHALRLEVVAPPRGECPHGRSVARSLYEHDRLGLPVGHPAASLWGRFERVGHQTVGQLAWAAECDVVAAVHLFRFYT